MSDLAGAIGVMILLGIGAAICAGLWALVIWFIIEIRKDEF